MKNSSTSRRAFLGNLAILSAGTALGGVNSLLPVQQPAADLQAEWKNFYRRHGGQPDDNILSVENNTLLPCKGHIHQPGTVISFPGHYLLAQPTWVYWSEQKKSVADVIITFYDASGTKQFRLNRFELEALGFLATQEPETDLLALLNKAKQTGSSQAGEKAPLLLQAKIRTGRQLQIRTRLFEKESSAEKQLFNHA